MEKVVFREGKTLYLRPMDESDLGLMLRWVNSQEINEFFPRDRPVTSNQEKKWLEKKLSEESNDIFVGISLKGTDELIGTASLHRVNLTHGTAWFGIMIGSSRHWGNGYGREAAMLLFDVGFNRLNLRKICWAAYGTNTRSIACAKKCGCVEEGRQRFQFRRGDQLVDEVYLGVLREDWLPLWLKFKEESQ